MQREVVEKTLCQYRHNKGRCEFLAVEIDKLEYEIKLGMANIVADEAAIGAQVISDMPHGTKIGNPTEETGIRLADGWVPQYIKDMREEVAKLRDEQHQLMISVNFVDAWLRGLSEREAWIIKVTYIDNESWERIASMHKKEFDSELTAKTLRKHKKAAFEKICLMAR